MKKLILLALLFIPLLGWALDYEQINESGFSDASNVAARLFRHHGWLFALTENENGVQLWRKDKADNDWTQLTETKLTESASVEFGPVRVFKERIYLVLQNETTGVEVWSAPLKRFRNGLPIWKQVNEDGFSDPANGKIKAFYVHDGVLHVTVENSNGYAQIWATEEGEDWSQLSTDGLGQDVEKITTAAFFKDYYYVGTSSGVVLRSADKETWEVVEELSEEVTAMRRFKEKLYVASGAKLYQSDDGETYEQVGADAFTADSDNTSISRLWPSPSHGYYLPGPRVLILATVNANGFQVWKSEDGETWEETVVTDGLGNNNNEEMNDFVHYQGKTYLSTRNTTDGTEIYRLSK